MSCRQLEGRIALYIDGALERDGARILEEHLRSCRACAEFAERLEFDRGMLGTTPMECMDVDFAALRAAIRQEIAQEPRSNLFLPALGMAAAILLAAGIAANWPRTSQVKPGAPTSIARQALACESCIREKPKPAKPRRRRASSAVPHADPDLEAALRDFVASESAPSPADESMSPIAIRIMTSDPNVVLILLQESGGGSDE